MIITYGKNGAGKTYLVNKLLQLGYSKSINYTTRNKRTGEIDGIDYHFVTKEIFEKLLEEGFFVEYQKRKDDYYGTPLKSLNESSILVSSDLNEVSKHYYGNIDAIYIDAPLEIRYKRVAGREISQKEIFERFNAENYNFLYDFYGYFIDNSREDNSSLEQILSLLQNNGQNKINNRKFVNKQVEKGIFLSKDDEMLAYLQYEEYLLRKLYLAPQIAMDNILSYYIEEMKKFMESQGVAYEQVEEDSLSVKLNAEYYYTQFDKRKILK